MDLFRAPLQAEYHADLFLDLGGAWPRVLDDDLYDAATGGFQDGTLAVTAAVTWAAAGSLLQSTSLAVTAAVTWAGAGSQYLSANLAVTAPVTWSGAGSLLQSASLAVTAPVTWSSAGSLLHQGSLPDIQAGTPWLCLGTQLVSFGADLAVTADTALAATGTQLVSAAAAMFASLTWASSGGLIQSGGLTFGSTTDLFIFGFEETLGSTKAPGGLAYKRRREAAVGHPRV